MDTIIPEGIQPKSIIVIGELVPQTPYWVGLRPPQTPAEMLFRELDKFNFLGSC